MTKEELKLEALKYLESFKDCANCKHRWGDCADELDEDCLINNCYSATPKEQDIYLAGAEPREKRIEKLEEKISVLLSCKNCPENKGVYICAKEYENKCLAQKIQFIKELQEENAELERKLEQTEKDLADYQFNYPTIKELEKENAELKEQCSILADCNSCTSSCKTENLEMKKQLSKAKELLKQWLQTSKASGCDNINIVTDTEQFLNSEGK